MKQWQFSEWNATRAMQVWDEKTSVQRASIRLQMSEEERRLSRSMTLLEGLYARLVEGIIDRDEYLSLKEHYQTEYQETKERYDDLKKQEQDILRCGPTNPMFDACRPLYQAKELTEELIHTLIARITVHDNSRLDIELVYQDEFLMVARFLEGVMEA